MTPPEAPPADAPDGLGLIETMRAVDGEVPLLHLHLARLGRSARALGFALDRGAVSRAVRDLARETTDAASAPAAFPAAAPTPLGLSPEASGARLRLVLARDGTFRLAAGPLAEAPWRTAAVYPEPLREAGTWRCIHKTTARAHYNRALTWAEAHGVDEPLLVGARGHVVEGARSSVFVREAGQLVTPPLAAGGLPGVMRAWLLENGAGERPLAPADLAGEVLLANAVRGLVPVRVVRPDAPRHRADPDAANPGAPEA